MHGGVLRDTRYEIWDTNYTKIDSRMPVALISERFTSLCPPADQLALLSLCRHTYTHAYMLLDVWVDISCQSTAVDRWVVKYRVTCFRFALLRLVSIGSSAVSDQRGTSSLWHACACPFNFVHKLKKNTFRFYCHMFDICLILFI